MSGTRSLFLFHVGSNEGYAIRTLEKLFLLAGLELARGDVGGVHFGYRDLERGPSPALPPGIGPLLACDFRDVSDPALARFAEFVRDNRINLVVVVDMQPVHPLCAAARSGGARTVLAYWGAPISSAMPAWKRWAKRAEIALARSKVDGLVFESDAMADLAVLGRGVPRSMVEVVKLGVDTARFALPRGDHVHAGLGIPADRRVVVYAGHMEERKGVRVLVHAAIDLLTRKRRTDVAFLLCGDRPGERAPYEALYAGLGVADLIRFGGYRSDLPEIYASAFCGVLPSTGWDSFTCGALEMAAAGLPVVAARLQGLAEAVVDGETGLHFDPGDAGGLADAIACLLDDPGKAEHLGRQGHARCLAEFTLDAHQRRFLAAVRRFHDYET